MPAWTDEIEIAYDFGHLYVLDGAGHWSDGPARVDLRMPHVGEFGVPVTIEGYNAKPALDLAAWDHVAEFSLRVVSDSLAFASGGVGAVRVGIANGAYRARWSARRSGAYRFQLWPGPPAAPRAELKRPAELAGELGDIPSLLHDEGVQALGAVVGTRVRGDALQLYVRLSAWKDRVWSRTVRCDGAVRWQATSEPFTSACLHAEHPGAAAVRRRARRAVLQRRPVRSRTASSPRCAPRTTRRRGRTSRSRRAAWPSASPSATAASPAVPSRCCVATPTSPRTTAWPRT